MTEEGHEESELERQWTLRRTSTERQTRGSKKKGKKFENSEIYTQS